MDDTEGVTVDVGLVENVLVTDALTEPDDDNVRERTADGDDVGEEDSHTVVVDDTLAERLDVTETLALLEIDGLGEKLELGVGERDEIVLFDGAVDFVVVDVALTLWDEDSAFDGV